MKEKKQKDKIKKGSRGYIDAQKKKRIRQTLLYCLIGIAIFVLGLCLNKFEKSNIFTVIAILAVLPAAKALVGFIVLAPFHSVKASLADSVKKLLGEHDVIYTDMVFTSPEKVMFLAFLVIREGEIVCLAGREKEDLSYIEKYLKEELKKRMLSKKLYFTADEKAFQKHLMQTEPAKDTPSQELQDYLLSLMV